jgi:hypothetical protein
MQRRWWRSCPPTDLHIGAQSLIRCSWRLPSWALLALIAACSQPSNNSVPSSGGAQGTAVALQITQVTLQQTQVALAQPLSPTPFSPRPSVTSSVARTPTNVSVRGDTGWQDTGIVVSARDRVSVTYITGQWTYVPGTIPPWDASGFDYICAEKIAAASCREAIPDFPKGALIGRVGDQMLRIGQSLEFTPRASGPLFLRMNQTDNSTDLASVRGAITVQVVVQH